MAGMARRSTTGILGAALATLALLLVGAPAALAAPPTFTKAFAPDVIGPGSTTTLTFSITNGTEPVPVENLAFTDTLPAGVTIAAAANATNTCDGTLSAPDGGTTITFTDGDVGVGVTCTITVDVTSATPGTHTNTTGDLTSAAGNSGTATDDLTVDATLPGFSKAFAPSTVDLGERSTLTLTIDNTAGASPLTAMSFTDTLPSGLEVADPADASTDCGTATVPAVLTAEAGSETIALTHLGTGGHPSVPAGGTCTVVVDVTTTAGGLLVNSSDQLDADGESAGKANAPLTVTVADLHVQKDFVDDPLPPGGTGTLRFVVRNLDRSDEATDITFSDDLAAALVDLTVIAVPAEPCGPGSSIDTGDFVTLTGGSLDPEGVCTFDVTVSVPPGAAAGQYVNTTSAVTGTVGSDPVTGNAASGVLFVSEAPSLTKAFTDDPVGAGGTVTLRFTITDNTDAAGSSDIAFVDELTNPGLPSGLPGGFLPAPISAVLPADGFCGGGSSISLVSLGTDREGLSVTGASLAAGTTCSFDVALDIPVGFPGGTYTNVTGPISATVGGNPVTGRPATADLVVYGAPSLTKEFTDDPVGPGDAVTLEFTLSYDPFAPADATGIGFTDDLTFVAGLTATGLPVTDVCGPGNGTLTGSAGETLLTFSGGSLAPGETCTFSVALATSAATPQGIHTNTTSDVSATVGGVAVAGPGPSDDLMVADLTLTKAFTDDPVLPGGTVTLEFTLTNDHPTDDATAVSFADDLDGTLPGLAAAAGELPLAGCGGTLSGSAGDTFLTFSGGSVPAGTSCSFSLTLDVPAGAVPDTYANTTAGFAAIIASTLVALRNATDDLTVADPPSLALTKSFTNDPVTPGSPVNLRFRISNPGVVAIDGIGFTDDLAAALAGLAATGGALSGICGPASTLTPSAGGTLLTFAGGELAPGASCTFNVGLTVPNGAAPGLYPNITSTVTGDASGTPVDGPAATDGLRVRPRPERVGDLSIEKTDSSDPAVAGQNLTYTVTVSNAGPQGLDAVVTDTLPAGVTLVGTTGCAEDPAGVPACTLGTVPAGGSKSFTVEVAIDSGFTGTLTNAVSVATSDTDTDASNNSASEDTEVVAEADLAISKADDVDPAVAGQDTVTYTVTVDNLGPSDASGVTVTDTLPGGVTLVATNGCAEDAGGVPTCTLGDIPAGGSASYTIEVTVDAAALGTITNEATVSSATDDPEPGNDTATEDTEIEAEADLSIDKTDDIDPVPAGDSLVYTVTVDNAGPSDATGVVVTDTLPAGAALVATSGCAEDPGGVPLCTLGTIPAGGSASYTIEVTVPGGEPTITNEASVAATTPDPDSGNNTASEDTEVILDAADLSITKESTHDPVQAGSTLVYHVTVTNAGPDPATNVVVTDTLPAGVEFKNTTGCAEDNNGVPTCSLGTIAAGDSVTYKVRVKVDRATRGEITNTVTVASDLFDPNPADNTATETNTVRRGGRTTRASHDGRTGIWTIERSDGTTVRFYFGDPGDRPMVGDWDCDGIDTPGLYRPADGYVYLRNSNTQGIADVSFFFGNPSDVALAGDFDGDGCDSVSVYRPAEARFYISHALGSGDTGLGAAAVSFAFGDPGDLPFVVDHDDNGIDDVAVYRPTNRMTYVRLTLTSGPADAAYRSPGRPGLTGRFFGPG